MSLWKSNVVLQKCPGSPLSDSVIKLRRDHCWGSFVGCSQLWLQLSISEALCLKQTTPPGGKKREVTVIDKASHLPSSTSPAMFNTMIRSCSSSRRPSGPSRLQQGAGRWQCYYLDACALAGKNGCLERVQLTLGVCCNIHAPRYLSYCVKLVTRPFSPRSGFYLQS